MGLRKLDELGARHIGTTQEDRNLQADARRSSV
jgi:hypothetical protein